MTLNDAEKYFSAMIPQLEKMCCDESPWVFLCGAAVIEYLSKLACGKQGSENFSKFIKNYMHASYREFRFGSGKQDLPEQMYYVLRCGIVHSFSLMPDKRGQENGGRDRSIALSHDASHGHIKHVSTGKAPDACCLNAYKFVSNLADATQKLFNDAKANRELELGITNWLKEHPPIASDFSKTE